MRKTKHLFLALLAVSALSTAWASNLPGTKPDSVAAKTAYDVIWAGETNVVYNALPQTGLTASYVDGNGQVQQLTNFVYTKVSSNEIFNTPPVDAGAWTVTAVAPAGITLNSASIQLNIQKATVYVTGATAEIAKFADGTPNGVVTNQGVLNGVMGNDPISHHTTAIFSNYTLGTNNATITLWYSLVCSDTNMLKNYAMTPASQVYTTSGVIIPNMLPDNNIPTTETVHPQNGIALSAYGYCTGNTYNIDYRLASGAPDQYLIDFDDASITDVAWTNLATPGQNGTINVALPAVDLATGDYAMSIYFRDSRYPGLVSDPFTVNLHVNLPETYTMPLFDNVIALVNTCNCFSDIQWYHRADANDTWAAIPGANGYYYREEGGLTGEYFVKVNMNGVETYTCPQTDMTNLITDGNQAATVAAYPNPTTETVTITVSGSDSFTHTMTVVSTLGVEMESRTFEGESTSIDMRSFQQGNYIVNVDGMVVRVIKK